MRRNIKRKLKPLPQPPEGYMWNYRPDLFGDSPYLKIQEVEGRMQRSIGRTTDPDWEYDPSYFWAEKRKQKQ